MTDLDPPRRVSSAGDGPTFCRICGLPMESRIVDLTGTPKWVCPAGHGQWRNDRQSSASKAADPSPSEKRPRLGDWGWSPQLAVVAALALFAVSLADRQAQLSQPGGYAIFWAGVLLIFVPITSRLCMSGLTRRETAILLTVLALSLYVVKVLHSPFYFTFPDEFIHWRTTDDIVQTGRMFSTNPLLPVSARYPGLEGATAAVVELGGLSIFGAGVIIAGAARLLLTLSLFLIFERLVRSVRVAGVATALYMTNANFVFFSAAYKYETLGLALAAVALFVIILWARTKDRDSRTRLAAVSVFACAGAAVSHHIAAAALGGVLIAWTATAARPQGSRPGRWRSPWPMMLASIGVTLLWLVFVAPIAAPYLAPVLTKAATAPFELLGSRLGFFSGSEERELFATAQGVLPAPAWERIDAVAAIGVVLVIVAVGAWQIIWHHFRTPLALAFAIIASAYPASLLLRLTRHGWETANRSSEFLYVAVALLAALGLLALLKFVNRHPAKLLLTSVVAGVLFIGGVFSGWPPQWRLPGPYTPGGGPLAINDEGLKTAFWAREHLDFETRVGADATNHVLLGSYGRQYVMTESSGGINPYWVILAPKIDQDKIDYLRKGRVDYLVVDSRLALQPELFAAYFPGTPAAQALAKFDGLERIYDSGNIAVYDVRDLWQTP
ncbi:MAG: DUF6541 family protein [Nocardioidaceae bacterium]